MSDILREAALEYHRKPTPGKISVVPTKPMVTQRDLSLAYSPGVAEACNAIAADPREAGNLTSRGNLVAVVTNGTAVLGLGNIGPLAGKPEMEGKACLFKKFAGIDVFDILYLADHGRWPSGGKGNPNSMKQVMAYLADRARVPIVPVGIWGTDVASDQMVRLQRPVLYVRIGAAFNLPPVERRQRDADLQRNTDEIMCRIAVLLPARYHGFYANHPRLVELYGGKPANAEPAAVNL